MLQRITSVYRFLVPKHITNIIVPSRLMSHVGHGAISIKAIYYNDLEDLQDLRPC